MTNEEDTKVEVVEVFSLCNLIRNFLMDTVAYFFFIYKFLCNIIVRIHRFFLIPNDVLIDYFLLFSRIANSYFNL